MKAPVTYSAILILIFGIGQVVGQDSSDNTRKEGVKVPALAIRWSPVHLAYFYPSLQIAVEHKVFKDLNFQYDFGYVLDYPNGDTEDYSNKRGYRLIGEMRYYVPHPPKIPFYVAAEYYYSNIQFDRSAVAGYDCNGGCAFYQYTDYKVENKHKGYGMKFGVLLYPGWNKNKSFFFDINVGIANRTITYTDVGKPTGVNITYFDDYDESRRFWAPNERDITRMRLVLGVRIGYRIL
jgi:hypothetical protein